MSARPTSRRSSSNTTAPTRCCSRASSPADGNTRADRPACRGSVAPAACSLRKAHRLMDFQLFLLFLQQGVASGLIVGSVYALLALAIVIIFKTSEVPNFAQGEMLMAAGYVALYLLVF